MSEKDEEPLSTSAPPYWQTAGVLGNLAPTNPAVLQVMAEARLGNIHYAAIGRVAAAWAHFEALVDMWLHEFAGVDTEVGVCFTGQMIGARPRIDGFIALARHRGAARKWNKKLGELAKYAQALGEQRNRAVHDVWELSDPMTPHRLEATARQTVRVLPVHVPTQDLLDLGSHIAQLEQRFDKTAYTIFNELRA